jgi:hypothetical protein
MGKSYVDVSRGYGALYFTWDKVEDGDYMV